MVWIVLRKVNLAHFDGQMVYIEESAELAANSLNARIGRFRSTRADSVTLSIDEFSAVINGVRLSFHQTARKAG